MSANAKHTPGPWKVQDLGLARPGQDYDFWNHYAVRAGNNVCLAVVGEVDRWAEHDNEANARLMAAAPDLLAALKDIGGDCRIGLPESCIEREVRPENWCIGCVARAAILKAEGDQP